VLALNLIVQSVVASPKIRFFHPSDRAILSEFGFNADDLFNRIFGGGFTFQQDQPETPRGRDLKAQM
jgi:hypothetical protein